MITGYEAFCIYNAIKLHFSNEKYDFFKYGGKSKVTVDSFEKRKDKYYFYKLSRRLPKKEDLILFLASNFVENENTWIGDLLLEESEEVYRKRLKVIQSISYVFENDCNKIFEDVDEPNDTLQVKNGEYPILLNKSLRKEIEIESLIILNEILNFLPMWKRKITDTVRWPEHCKKIEKYCPFIPKDSVKCKLILRKVLSLKEKIAH
jgi:hypothetical protein